MKYLIVLLALMTTIGCSFNDIVESNASTPQNFDLADTDQDGVIMARERCAGTIIGAAVDNYGCGSIKDINERQDLKILFSNNSDVIKPQYYNQIERVANVMQTYPGTKVIIEGHTSKRGSYELNLALSQQRAKAVIKVLENTFGIDPSRLTAIGYSFDRPIDNSETLEAAERNRRVIAVVTADDTIPQMRWHIYTVDEQTD
jgi:outer membrane protein OmpA-like peptidoglycan-associated protein